MKPKVVVIVGPTASGKTALSIELAKKLDGEIISSDSMQIYKDMDIGTAKVTKEEAQGIKHYLVDFVSPDQRYTVSDFKKDSEKAIEEILAKPHSENVAIAEAFADKIFTPDSWTRKKGEYIEGTRTYPLTHGHRVGGSGRNLNYIHLQAFTLCSLLLTMCALLNFLLLYLMNKGLLNWMKDSLFLKIN